MRLIEPVMFPTAGVSMTPSGICSTNLLASPMSSRSIGAAPYPFQSSANSSSRSRCARVDGLSGRADGLTDSERDAQRKPLPTSHRQE